MTMPASKDSQPELERMTLNIMRDLYERHDAFKGWWEPVYGKKYHIGDTCRACGTHFRGLEDDIKNAVTFFGNELLKQHEQTLIARGWQQPPPVHEPEQERKPF